MTHCVTICFSLWRKIVETPHSGVILQEMHTQGQVGSDIGGKGGYGDKEKFSVDSMTEERGREALGGPEK